MAEKRVCGGCGKTYWWPGERWQHEPHFSLATPQRVTKAEKVVVDAPVVVDAVVDTVSHENLRVVDMVVDNRSMDRHRKTAARRLYLRMKQRESRARRTARRVSA